MIQKNMAISDEYKKLIEQAVQGKKKVNIEPGDAPAKKPAKPRGKKAMTSTIDA